MSHGSHGEHEVLNLGGELLPAQTSKDAWKREKKLDDGWPESVEEHSERYKYEDLIAWNKNIDIYDDA